MGRWIELTEEHEESHAEQDQNVRDVCDVCVCEQLHLLFSGTHEEEASGNEQERCEILEAVWIWVLQVVGDCAAVPQYESDLDDASSAGGHKGETKYSVDHSRDRQVLRVS